MSPLTRLRPRRRHSIAADRTGGRDARSPTPWERCIWHPAGPRPAFAWNADPPGAPQVESQARGAILVRTSLPWEASRSHFRCTRQSEGQLSDLEAKRDSMSLRWMHSTGLVFFSLALSSLLVLLLLMRSFSFGFPQLPAQIAAMSSFAARAAAATAGRAWSRSPPSPPPPRTALHRRIPRGGRRHGVRRYRAAGGDPRECGLPKFCTSARPSGAHRDGSTTDCKRKDDDDERDGFGIAVTRKSACSFSFPMLSKLTLLSCLLRLLYSFFWVDIRQPSNILGLLSSKLLFSSFIIIIDRLCRIYVQ
jgi:hypothetical protein